MSPTTPAQAQQPQERLRLLDRLLRPFADVRACEAVSALVLAATIFTVMTAYYLLKIIREPLILTGGGAEVKSYAAAGQALLLIPVLRAHGAIARRVGRLKLIAAVFLFCAANLVIFSFLSGWGPSTSFWSLPSGASPTTSMIPTRGRVFFPSLDWEARSVRWPELRLRRFFFVA